MLALALTLAVAAQPPQPLDGPEQVRTLCDALAPAPGGPPADPVAAGRAAADHEQRRGAAVDGAYRVTIPAGRLRFDSYDPADGRLVLSDRAFLTGADGALHLWPVEERGLPVAVPPELAQRIVDAAARSELSLALVFRVPDEEEAACAHPSATRRYTLGVEPIAWEYVSGGAVLARGGAGEEGPAPTVAGGAVPRVEVEEPLGAGGEAVRDALRARRGDLEACYRRALQRDPALDGSVIAEVELGGAGAPRSARIAADSVQDDTLARCVRDVVAATRFPAARAGRAELPVSFSLQAPTAAR